MIDFSTLSPMLQMESGVGPDLRSEIAQFRALKA